MEGCLETLQHASVIAKYQASGEAVAKSLAHPTEFPKISSTKARNRVTNHQALLRKKLLEMQRQKAKIAKGEDDKKLKRLKHRKMIKEQQFKLVKSKVFEKSPSQCTDATLTSSLESFSLSSSDNSIRTTIGMQRPLSSTSEYHHSYGRVPKYILRRRIEEEEGEKASKGPKSLVPPAIEYLRKLSDVARLRSEYDGKIKAVKSSLLSLPFGIQSGGSMKKREHLEGKLKQLQHEKSFITEKRFYNEQRIIQLNAG